MQNGTYLEKKEACQKTSSCLFSDNEQKEGVSLTLFADKQRQTVTENSKIWLIYLFWKTSREGEAIFKL